MNLSWVFLEECVFHQMLESFRILVQTLKFFEPSHLYPMADVNNLDQGVFYCLTNKYDDFRDSTLRDTKRIYCHP